MVRRFLPYLRLVRGRLALGLIAGLPAALLQWLAPWPLKLIFDSVMSHHPLPSLLRGFPASPVARLDLLVMAMLVIAIGQGVATYFAARTLAGVGQRVILAIRCDLFRQLEAQSLAFHQRRTVGDLMSRLGGDTQALQDLLVNAVPTLVNNSLTLLGMLVIMAMVDWRYTLVALSLWPALYFTVTYFLPNIKAAQRQARRCEGGANAIAQEVLTSLVNVQAFGREPNEAERFERLALRGLLANQRATVLQAAFTPTTGVLMAAATVGVVWFGVRSVLSGQFTPGGLIVFMAYLRGMYAPVRQLAKVANVVSRGEAAAERIAEILEAREYVPERPDARRLTTVHGAVRFERVSVVYPNGQVALSEVDLTVPAGARVAIVGPTGSGKSTLLRLLLRFIDPTSGTVRLDGVDLRDLSLAHLREQIALVPQEAYIFHATVWENIAYGGTTMSREAAIAAARAAGVYNVLASLNDGFDTIVAERGMSLSGGQRQCLSLARAMARAPHLVLLDEPTTGLDVQAQGVLMEALARLSKKQTTFIISHDPSAVRDVDLVVVLEGGRVVACNAPERVCSPYLSGQSRHNGEATVLTTWR